MPEQLAHDLRMHPHLEQQRCRTVAQVVEAHPGQAGLLQQRVELAAEEVGWVDRPPDRVREHEVVVLPAVAGPPALLVLAVAVQLERLDRDGNQEDLTAGGPSLEPPGQVQRALVEVDVGPAEAEQLALPHPGRQGDDVERLEPIALDGLQEPPRLLWREGDELVVGLDRGRHQVGDVARREALTMRVLERVMQDPVKLEDRGRGEPCLDPPRVEPCEVRWFELGEPQLADVRVGVEPEQLSVALVGARADGRLDHLQPCP
ncbi:MAG TPA: hypothetical protein VFA45_24480 [Actinomycetes bacterium]|nr:hypothetical protein [Actinomycetes bacterium]